MSKYRPIYKKIWNDRDFKKSSKDEKLLFLYFSTCEGINNSGVYEIPLSTISEQTGIHLPAVKKILQANTIKNIKYDMENEIVFVVNARKYSPGGNPVQVEKGIVSEYKQNSKTFLWNSFLKLNPQFKDKFSTVGQPLVNGSIPIPLPIPIDSKDLTNNKPLKMEEEEKLNDNFDEDWKSYPKGGNRKKAFSYYSKNVGLDAEKREKFQGAMADYLASVENHKYLKLGETFFNQWPDLEIRATGPPVDSDQALNEQVENLKRDIEKDEARYAN